MSEVITKRLMTDDTGQEIVDALEDLALAVKPTGAEIDMSSTDTTKVKDAIETNSQAITNIQTATGTKSTLAGYETLTIDNCEAHNNIGVKYSKFLQLAVVQIYIKSLTANSRVKIGTLPTGYRPVYSIPYVGMGGASYTSKAYFTISDNGDIYVISEDTYAQGMIVFWTK